MCFFFNQNCNSHLTQKKPFQTCSRVLLYPDLLSGTLCSSRTALFSLPRAYRHVPAPVHLHQRVPCLGRTSCEELLMSFKFFHKIHLPVQGPPKLNSYLPIPTDPLWIIFPLNFPIALPTFQQKHFSSLLQLQYMACLFPLERMLHKALK